MAELKARLAKYEQAEAAAKANPDDRRARRDAKKVKAEVVHPTDAEMKNPADQPPTG